MDEDFCAACIKTEKENEWEFTSTNTEVQNQSGGGTNKDVLDRLESIERELAELKSREATEETPGLVRLTQSSAVTSSAGLALSGREKNAAIDGSIMNKLQEIKSLLSGTGARKVIHRTNAGTGWAGGLAAVSLEEPPGTNLAVILASLSAREGTVVIGTQTVTNNLYFMFRPYSGGKETSIIFDFENKEIRWM